MTTFTKTLPLLLALILLSGLGWERQASAQGFLVLAPDRGFLGNEEVQDVFAEFQARVPQSVLAFATAEKTEENLREALGELAGRGGAPEVVVLPLFLSDDEVLYRNARTVLQSVRGGAVRFASPLGESYLAEEILFDRVAGLLEAHGKAPAPAHATGGHGATASAANPHSAHGAAANPHAGHPAPAASGDHLVLVAGGAGSAGDEAAIKADLEPLVQRAVKKFGLHGGDVVALYDWSAPDAEVDGAVERSVAAVQAGAAHGRALVVPFNMSKRLTLMMSDWAQVQHGLSSVPAAVHDGEGVLPHPNVLRWLVRSANSYLPLADDEIGVIFVPHGSDFNWNKAMKAALDPLRDQYVTEDAFSMVDPEVVERAVRRLEDKGMKAAVLVRIFSLERNFKGQTEYMFGLRPDFSGGMHGSVDRIRTHLRLATAGGMEAHPLLAEGMLQRAKEISSDPRNETVILVGHGSGGDADNEHWLQNLAKIAAHVKEKGAFRDVKGFTWREDWPAKREPAVREIRAAVEAASRDGGTALVIPVRTIDQGPEAKYLEGLTYRHGFGFAPHPAFVQWVESVIEEGKAALRSPDTSTASAN